MEVPVLDECLQLRDFPVACLAGSRQNVRMITHRLHHWRNGGNGATREVAGGMELLVRSEASGEMEAGSFHCLTWRIHEGSSNLLELCEASLEQPSQQIGLRLRFAEPLLPFVSADSGSQGHRKEKGVLYVVTEAGVGYRIKVPEPSRVIDGHIELGLQKMQQQDIQEYDIFSDLMKLEAVTAATGSTNLIVMGGQNGSVMCFPFGTQQVGPSVAAFELREGEGGIRRLWSGVMNRGKLASPLRDLFIRHHRGLTLVFAFHLDGTLRVWDVRRRTRVHCQTLPLPDQGGGIEAVPVRLFLGEIEENSNELLMTVLYRDVSSEGASERLGIFTWRMQMDGDVRWDEPNLKKKFSLEGRMLDFKLLEDLVWILLEDSRGCFSVQCACLSSDWGLVKCKLVEEELAERLLLKGISEEKDSLFLEHISKDNLLAASLNVSDFFCRRLLLPGVLHRGVLRDTLGARGRLTESEFAAMSSEALKATILTVMDGQALPSSVKEDIGRWLEFCGRYLQLWRRRSRPMSLVVNTKTQMAGLIRKHTFSVFRSIDESDHVSQNEIREKAWCPQLTETLRLSADEETVMGALMKCIELLIRFIGCFGTVAFDDLVIHGDTDVRTVMDQYVRLIQLGCSGKVMGAGPGKGGNDAGILKEKQQHLEHRVFLVDLLCHLRHAVDIAGSWQTVFALLRKCLDELDDVAAGAVSAPARGQSHAEGNNIGGIAVQTVAHAVRQIVGNRYVVSRNIYWLLSLLNKLSGQVDIAHDDVAVLQVDLLPRAEGVMVNILLLSWLVNTYAAPPMAAGNDDFSNKLSSLHISDVRGKHSLLLSATEETLADMILNSQGVQEEHHVWMKSLAPDEVLCAAQRFVAWIRHGSLSNPCDFSTRAARIGLVFLENTQYDRLQVFLRKVHQLERMQLADGSSVSRLSAVEFLIGFACLACAQTSNEGDPAVVDKHVADAIRWFFRSAAGIDNDDEVLFQILESFRHPESEMEGLESSSPKMDYYETVMHLFERYNRSEGAAEFARAALQEAELVDGEESRDLDAVNHMQTDDDGKDNESRAADTVLKSRLWANLFKFYMDLGRHKAAYCATLSNLDPDSKTVCLRRFVVVLSEHAAGEMLCGTELPYDNMLEKVEEELRWKAENSDVNARPNPYNLLYCYHSKRHNWRRAALYMYRLAMRLGQEGSVEGARQVSVLQQQAHCLAASLNSLRLVHPDKAWLDVSDYEHMPELAMPAKRLRFSSNTTGGRPQIDPDKEHRWPSVMSIAELEKQYAVVAAKLELAKHCSSQRLPGPDATPSEVMWCLLQFGMFDMAFTIVFLFWKNSALSRELEKIFSAMTMACCRRQLQEKTKDPSSSASPAYKLSGGSASMGMNSGDGMALMLTGSDGSPDGDNSSSAFPGCEMGTAASCWENLRTCLGKYLKYNPRLRVVVAETILTIDRRMQLPLWLLQLFKGTHVSSGMAGDGQDPAALLRIFLDFGLLFEAAALLLEYLQAWARQNPVTRKRLCAVWFPYTLLDRLKKQMEEAAQSESNTEISQRRWTSLQADLDKALEYHFAQTNADSLDVKQMAFIEMNREDSDNKLVVVM